MGHEVPGDEVLGRLLGGCPVLPVVTVAREEDGPPLARALIAGGVPGVEVTLRTPAALGAIARIAAEVPGAIVGAGTVLDEAGAEAAARAGARFLVSPGATPALLAAARATGLPHLPGAGTVSEAMRLREEGFRLVKFFPAGPMGGLKALAAWAPVLPDLRVCPTGGVEAAGAPAYLALPTVPFVGGSWLAPPRLVAARNWAGITALAREAAALRG